MTLVISWSIQVKNIIEHNHTTKLFLKLIACRRYVEFIDNCSVKLAKLPTFSYLMCFILDIVFSWILKIKMVRCDSLKREINFICLLISFALLLTKKTLRCEIPKDAVKRFFQYLQKKGVFYDLGNKYACTYTSYLTNNFFVKLNKIIAQTFKNSNYYHGQKANIVIFQFTRDNPYLLRTK